MEPSSISQDYGRFVADRREAWSEAEAELSRLGRAGLSRLDFDALERFVAAHRQRAAELGVVQRRWPGSEAEITLRRLVLVGHGVLRPPTPGLERRLLGFLADEYPKIFQACWPSVRVSGLVFLGGVWLGVVLTVVNDGVGAVLVGAEQLEFMRRGEIWTDDLQDVSPIMLSVRIFINNIFVALIAWAGGVVWGLGSVLVLLRNGAMVGSLLALASRYGLTDRLLAFIPAHGMLELFLIVVAGAAGFELARGALGEGEGTRAQRFQQAAGRSFLLVGGTVPWFVFLGLVEGFLSPQMGFATEIKLVVGAVILGIFLVYALFTRSPS